MGSFYSNPSQTETIGNEKKSDASFYDSYIKNLINRHSIVVFSKTTCPYCDRAKDLLNKSNVKYHSIELDVNSQCPKNNCAHLSSSLVLQTRLRTVPQIFVDGKLIGGCSDLESIIQKDEKFLENLAAKSNQSKI
jgi:glutaredoxin 3